MLEFWDLPMLLFSDYGSPLQKEGLKIKGLDVFGYVYGLFIRNVRTISEKYLLRENVFLKRQGKVISHPITFNLIW